jgi:hypothetical protein
MPIVSSGSSTPGIGAQILGSPTICTFGGLNLPNNQGVLAPINLNDVASWFLQDISIDHSNRSVGVQPLVARARSVYVSDDFLNKIITLTLRYQETNLPLGQSLAAISQAGEQQLPFDNVTYILAKYRGARTPKLIRKFAPYLWEVQLEFICREPWFKDINNTQTTSVNLVAAPTTAPSAAALAGGSLATGTYTLAYTYVTASGETAASPATSLAPGFAQSDYRTARVEWRSGSRSTGTALQGGMRGQASRTRTIRGVTTSRIVPQGSAVVLSGASLQISVGAVTFPSWATGVKWYFTGSSPTTGFTVQNANGNAFTLNTAGNGVAPPTTSGGTATFYVTYSGSVWAEPVFSLLIPTSNPNTITQLVITNNMSAESLTINFPGGLLGGRAYTITIDSSQWTVVDQTGTSYDYQGSFPMLYPPAGQVNPFTVQCVGTPNNPSGLSLQATYNSRWEV